MFNKQTVVDHNVGLPGIFLPEGLIQPISSNDQLNLTHLNTLIFSISDLVIGR